MALYYKIDESGVPSTRDGFDSSISEHFNMHGYTMYVSNDYHDGFFSGPVGGGSQGSSSTAGYVTTCRYIYCVDGTIKSGNYAYVYYVRAYNNENITMPEDCSYLFGMKSRVSESSSYSYYNVGSPFILDDLSKFDFSATTNMEYFYGYEYARLPGEYLPAYYYDYLCAMNFCKKGTLDFTQALGNSLENVVDMSYAFSYAHMKCIKFNQMFKSLKTTEKMFYYCNVFEIYSYKNYNGRSLVTKENSANMFYGATNLPGYTDSKVDINYAYYTPTGDGYFANPGTRANCLNIKYLSNGLPVRSYIKLNGVGNYSTPCIKVDGEGKQLE